MCTNPLKGWLNENGSIVRVTYNNVVALAFDERRGDFNKIYSGDTIPEGAYTRYVDIPCRRCLDCFNQCRREWVTRAVCESKLHPFMLFCTFTYDDDKVPKSNIVTADGEILTHNTLNYRDFQLFIKKLRKKINRPIRYMVCGEYGNRTFRPHYHAILYSVCMEDFKTAPEWYKRNSHGDDLYNIPELTELWSHGFVVVSQANTATMAYVAGYVAKKRVGDDAKQLKEFGIVPPFIRSSSALGAEYIDAHFDKFENIYDYMPVATDTEPFKIYLTQNWKRKFEKKNFRKIIDLPEGFEYIDSREESDKIHGYLASKDKRRMLFFDERFQLLDTDMSKEEYNASQNANFRKSSARKRGEY